MGPRGVVGWGAVSYERGTPVSWYGRSFVQAPQMYKLGFNQNYYTFTSILLTQIVMCSEFISIEFIDYECLVMRSIRGLKRDNEPLFVIKETPMIHRSYLQAKTLRPPPEFPGGSCPRPAREKYAVVPRRARI